MSEDEILGKRVGHIRIAYPLGKGGMGSVFAGYDEKLKRKVAVKAIQDRARLDSKAKARFLREARVLSQLDHPNICRIHDYIEEEESDFLVLEYIEGRSLRQAIQEAIEPSLKMKIAGQIAEVLIAAHENGVVHRDLKPANIMLTEDGDVKVLDFGLSRFVDRQASLTKTLVGRLAQEETFEETVEKRMDVSETELGTVIGTPTYMSPEQARGEPASPASDMYSFGLLLQELFTGESPYEPDLPIATQLTKARKGETRLPTGVAPDLAALIGRLKSLAPGARPSAVDAAERLRWIREKPKRRAKRLAVAAAILILAFFAGAMTLQSLRIAKEVERANREAETARQVSDFLVGLFKVSDPGEARGNSITAREILDKGAEKIRSELQDQPSVQARLMDTMGNVYESLGLYAQARPLLEEAVENRIELYGENHLDVAASLNNLSRVLAETAQYDDARRLLERALEIRTSNLGTDHPAVATVMNNLAAVSLQTGDFEKARELFERAVEIRQKTLDPDDPEVAQSLNNLAALLFQSGDYEKARPLYERALRIRENALGSDHPLVGHSLNNLGELMDKTGDFPEARVYYDRALAIFEKSLGPDHPNVGATVHNLASLLLRTGELDSARPLFERALAIFTKAVGPDHPHLAWPLDGLANLLLEKGDYAEAEQLFQRAIRIREEALGVDHPLLADSLESYAVLLRKKGRDRAAQDLEARATAIREKLDK